MGSHSTGTPSALGAELAIHDVDAVAGIPVRRRSIWKAAHGTIFHAHAHLITGRCGACAALDFIAGKAAAYGAGDGRQGAAMAAANLVTEQAAKDCTGSHADATRWWRCSFDGGYGFYPATTMANGRLLQRFTAGCFVLYGARLGCGGLRRGCMVGALRRNGRR